MNIQSRKLLQALVALIVIGVSLWVVFRTLHGPRINQHPLDALASAIAEQTAALVAGHGKVVVVARDLRRFGAGVSNPLYESLQRALQAHPGVVIGATQWVDPDNLPPTDPCFSAKLYFEVLAAHPDAGAVVSLIDAPLLSDADCEQLPAQHPKVVAVLSASTVGLRDKLFAAGVLGAAIIPRQQPASETAAPQTSAEWFARIYEVVTR